MIEAYIRRGTSELNDVNKLKIQHFDVIRLFKETVDQDEFKEDRVLKKRIKA